MSITAKELLEKEQQLVILRATQAEAFALIDKARWTVEKCEEDYALARDIADDAQIELDAMKAEVMAS